MNKLLLKTSKALADTALRVTSANVNSLCNWYFYQGKLPENAKKLIKK